MVTSIKDICLNRGMFSKEFNTRLKSGQIHMNGSTISGHVELEIDKDIIDIGEFLFSLMKNPIWAHRLAIFDFESLANSNIENDLVEHMRHFTIIRTSKKDVFVVKRIKSYDFSDISWGIPNNQ